MTLVKAGMGLCVAALLSVAVHPAAADQYTDQIGADQGQVAANNAKIAAAQHDDALRQQYEAQIRSQLAALDAEITTTQTNIAAVQATLLRIDSDLASARQRLAHAEAQLAADKAQLAQRLVIIYELQQESTTLNNLLSSGSFNEFWSRLLETRRISAMENQEVQQIKAVKAGIQLDVATITSTQQQQQQTLAQLGAERSQLQQQQDAAQNDLAYQQALEQQDQAEAQQIAAANHQLDAEIAQLQAEEQAALAAGGGNGQFAWPDSGPITQGFGCTPFTFEMYDPACPSKHFHTGIDIAGPCGADISAADSGIAYQEPYQSYGYGNYIIIVHGNGWESLYGHMSGFAVGSGVTVHRGEVIGYEGSTGNSTGCHLHFGISQNGSWVNPLSYLS